MKRHRIYISREVKTDEDSLKLIRRSINAALNEEKVPMSCEVYVTVTNDEEIHQLNLEHRNVDSPTDVLSFPMQELSPGSFEPQDIDLDSGRVLLGDIVISVERARAQAEEYGHSEAREIGYLCVHSLLHLLGYDHMEEEDKKLMRSREEAVMAQLDLKRDEE